MTINCYREHLQLDLVKLKKYFYALRPILATKWIIKHHTFPPIVFSDLLRLISSQYILAEIDRLLTLKATAQESTLIPVSPILTDFIHIEIENCELAIKLIPKQETDPLALNNLFKRHALGSS